MKPMLEVRGITKTFGKGGTESKTLKGVNLSLKKGEMVVIMGPSGSGKSTFLHILGGLEPPTSGEILFDGQEMKNFTREPFATEYRREKIGFVFQFFNLISSLTTVENVMLPLVLAGKSQTEARQRAVEMLKHVGLSHRLDYRPSDLSGGQQQRVALARALVHQPPLLLADEPTGSLDSQTSIEVLMLLEDIKRKLNQTIVMVTHDPMVATYGDRVIFFYDGKITHEWINPQDEDRKNRSLLIMDQLRLIAEGATQ